MFQNLYHTTADFDIAILKTLADDLHRRFEPPILIVELGTWVGGTALALSDDPRNVVFCVDNWCGNIDGEQTEGPGLLKKVVNEFGSEKVFETFCGNVKDRMFRSIVPCVGSTETWRKVWPFPVHMVFVDADHSYEAAKRDIQWEEHVMPGGFVSGHDYSEHFPGVVKAANEYGIDGNDGAVWWKKK